MEPPDAHRLRYKGPRLIRGEGPFRIEGGIYRVGRMWVGCGPKLLVSLSRKDDGRADTDAHLLRPKTGFGKNNLDLR
jgi:hypothetical protein